MTFSCTPETPHFLKKCIQRCNLKKCKTEIADHDLGKSCLAINDDSEVYGIDQECGVDDDIIDEYSTCLYTFIRGQNKTNGFNSRRRK